MIYPAGEKKFSKSNRKLLLDSQLLMKKFHKSTQKLLKKTRKPRFGKGSRKVTSTRGLFRQHLDSSFSGSLYMNFAPSASKQSIAKIRSNQNVVKLKVDKASKRFF